jgi:hypothetical protein
MKADACDYGAGVAMARKGPKPGAAADEEAEEDTETAPDQALEAMTPGVVTPHENGRFEHLENGDSTTGNTGSVAHVLDNIEALYAWRPEVDIFRA